MFEVSNLEIWRVVFSQIRYSTVQGRTSDKADIPTVQLTVETKLFQTRNRHPKKRLLEGLRNCVFWLICGIAERNTKNEVLFSEKPIYPGFQVYRS